MTECKITINLIDNNNANDIVMWFLERETEIYARILGINRTTDGVEFNFEAFDKIIFYFTDELAAIEFKLRFG